MKVNVPVRLKNPWFWVGVVSIIITALGVDPQQFVSWESLGGYIVDVLKNPVQLVTVVLAVLALLAGCGKEQETPTVRIGVALYQQEDTFLSTVVQNLEQLARAEEQGRQPVIIGAPDHPEVAAIAGWCSRPVVLSGVEDLEKWLEEQPERRDLPLTFVSQTTSTTKNLE